MHVIRSGESIFHSFKDGENTFEAFISTEAHFDDFEINEFIAEWAEGEEASLTFKFSLRECIDSMIDLHRHINTNELVFSSDTIPMVDSLRAELLEAVARLDEIKFKD